MTTLQQLKQKKIEEFRNEYITSYGNILPKEILKNGNDWFELFLSSVMDEIQDATIKAAQEEIERLKVEGGHTEACEDVLAMDYQIGLHKGSNSALSQSHSALNNLKTK